MSTGGHLSHEVAQVILAQHLAVLAPARPGSFRALVAAEQAAL